MATYNNTTIGYGSVYDIDLNGSAYTDWNYKWGWTGEFYVEGYTLYIERTDKANGLWIDFSWETTDPTRAYYTITEDSDGDTKVHGSVVFAKDGSTLSNVSLYRGILIINEEDDVNPQSDRWTTTVNGLNIYGEYAVCYAAEDSVLTGVRVTDGALYSHSSGMQDLRVEGLGKVRLYDKSETEELIIDGGFVQADSGSYIISAEVFDGELYISAGASADDVYVSDKGLLITEGSVAFRTASFGSGGTLVVTENINNNIMDYDFEAGSRVSFANGLYSTTASSGLNFAAGVIVGYGFDNERLSYRVGGVYYSANKNTSRNYVVTYETMQMTTGQQAYDMVIEDGGAFYADGGIVTGLTVNMNMAYFSGDAVGNNVVLNAPELIDSSIYCLVSDNAKLNGVVVNDGNILLFDGQGQAANVTLNNNATCFISSNSTNVKINTITVNNASHMDINGTTSVEHMILNSGVVEIAYSSQISDLLMNGGALHLWDGDDKVSNVRQLGGVIAVQGELDGITVSSGARLAQNGNSSSSGVISNMTVEAGAWLSISNISNISGDFNPDEVTVGYNFNSGYQTKGSESYKYIVTFYSRYYISGGYTAKEMCISVGNDDVVLGENAAMIGGDVENGCLTVEANSTMSGTINLYGETYYLDDDNGFQKAAGIHFLTDDTDIEQATFNFVLGQNKQLDEYIEGFTDLTDLGITFDEKFGDDEENDIGLSLKINEDLKSGEEYSMYLGTGFKLNSVKVYNKAGKYIGQVSYGKDLVADSKTISIRSLNSTTKTYERKWGIYVVSNAVDKTIGDIDANGRADVLMTISGKGHASYGSTGAWLIQDNDTAKWGNLSTLNSNNRLFGMGHVNSDKNNSDIYVENTATHTIGAWVTTESGEVGSWETVATFDSSTTVLGLGDFNGDEQSDLLLRNSNGAVGCYFTSGKTGWNYFQSLGNEWQLSTIGDFNNDGRDDVVLEHDQGFAGCWLTNADGTMAWSDLSTLSDGFEIVGAGDFNGDGTDDVLLKKGNYYGAWIVNNGHASDWMGLGETAGTVEQIADFNGDGTDDLRIRTSAGDLGCLIVNGADDLTWKYYGSVGSEWSTSLASLM